MAGIFEVQGFGALSEYNGQFSTASAAQSFQTLASLGSNSVALTVRIWTDSRTGSTVIADPAKTESDASLLAGFQAQGAGGGFGGGGIGPDMKRGRHRAVSFSWMRRLRL